MPNLPRHHLQTRRTARGLQIVVVLVAVLAVVAIVGPLLLASFNEVAAALTGGLPRGR